MSRGWAPTVVATALACAGMAPSALATHDEPLRGQWHLDEGHTTGDEVSSTPDSSGHGLTAIPVRFAADVPGRFGRAFLLGSSSQVRVAQNSLLEPAAVTVLAWVRATGDPGPYRNVAAKGADDVCGRASWALYTGANELPGLRFYVDNGSIAVSPSGGTALWDGQWHLVAGTYDGASVRLYVDGQEMGTGTPTSGTINYALPNGEFNIGRFPGANSCPPGFQTTFPGEIDETRVYSRALSQTELARLATATGPNPPVLEPDVGGPPPAGEPPLPVASFVSAKSAKVARSTWMSALVSTIPEGVTIKKYEWDFDNNGTYDIGCGGEAPAASHPFRKVGAYTIGLRLTDSLNRLVTTTQAVAVTKAEVNRARGFVATCEDPLGTNQPDRKDCVKTFAFSIVDVNGRGAPDQCFQIKSRINPVLIQARASQGGERISDKLLRVYHAQIAGPIALNGLPIPVPRNRITEYDSGEDTISLGNLPLRFLLPIAGTEPISVADIPLELKIKPVKGRFKLPPLKAGGVKIKAFGGLKLGGGIEIHLIKQAAEVFVSLKLPDFFNWGFNRSAEGQVVLRTTNAGGFEFEGARIKDIPRAYIGPLAVNNLYFNYRRTGEIWQGGASFQFLPVGPALNFSPPPYGIGLRGGRFDYAGAEVEFLFPPRPQLFPGIGLHKVGASFGVDPIRLTGTMGIDVAGIFIIDGSVFVGLASEEQPYDFPEEYAPPGLGFLAGETLDTFAIAIGGQAKINVPIVGDVPLVNAFVYYAYPDYARIGGGFKFNVAERFSVDGSVGGWIAVRAGKFNLEGKVQGCADIEVTKFCLGVSSVVSSKGIGFCTIVPIPALIGTIPVPAGIGYTWGGGIDVKVFSCNTDGYKEARPAVRGAQAGTAFTLDSGLPSAMVKVVGQGAVPKVELTGPEGERILAGGDEVGGLSENVIVIPQTPESTLLIGLKNPSGGRWTVAPREGSAPISSVASAAGLPDPSVKASVRGSGRSRVLNYRVKPAAGQRVTFFERGVRTYRRLGVARGKRGKIRFSPASGRRGQREIVAEVERNGVVVQNIVVTRYSAPRSARPARPRGLRVRRKRAGVIVRWRRSRGASRYAVTLRQSNGTEFFRETRRPSVLFRGINPLARGKVLVRGLRIDNVGGRTASERVPPPQAAKRRRR